MVDHIVLTIVLICPIVFVSMAQTNDDNTVRFIGINDLHGSQVSSPIEKASRFYRGLSPTMTSDWEIRPKLATRMVEPNNRLENIGELINQFDNQRQSLVSMLGARGLNNWKREGAETYKNMFLGVRG